MMADLALSSDGQTISGDLKLDSTAERSELTGSLKTDAIDLDKVLSLKGSGGESSSGDKVFPDDPIPFDALGGLDLNLSIARRYADSSAVDPTTEFGFRVSLVGVGRNDGSKTRRRSCRG